MPERIESYECDVTAADGAILHSCFRIVRDGNVCHIYDMRYETLTDRPHEFPDGQFVGLTEQRFGEIKAGSGMCMKVGRVWIGETGEWNVTRSKTYRGNLPINKCLELMRYGKEPSNA